jgi:hypothetical protein
MIHFDNSVQFDIRIELRLTALIILGLWCPGTRDRRARRQEKIGGDNEERTTYKD